MPSLCGSAEATRGWFRAFATIPSSRALVEATDFCNTNAAEAAGGHWLSRALLAKFDVIPSDERMTIDGKFYTSGGVTSGIDMALRVGEETARKIQLQIEYDPAPPFAGGTPMTSPPEITAALREAARERCAKRELMVAEAAARLLSVADILRS
jgi:hypothetical protein